MPLPKTITRIGVFCLLLVIAGCSSTGTRDGGPPPVQSAPQPSAPVTQPPMAPQPPPRPTAPPSTSAWKPLVDKAAQARGRGDYEQALALLERAQRIDPESGQIYLQLAQTHKARGDAAQARATAERGLLYCNGNTECNALRALAR